MGTLDVWDVTVFPDPSGSVEDFALTAPTIGTASEIHALTLEGWVAPRDGTPERIELVTAGHGPNWQINFNVHGPEIGGRDQSPVPTSASGFRHMISVTRVPREFKMRLFVRLASGERVHLARIQGRRQALGQAFDSRFRPLMLTTLGRTGGTWATLLLDQHPEIVGFRSFDYEPRAGAYWAEIFHALAEPKSYLQCLRAEITGADWWLGHNLAPPPRNPPDPKFEEWLGHDYVEGLVGIAKERIDTFYLKAIESHANATTAFFIEKYWPESFTQQLFWEIYPGAKEIFLIRDFRDMAASQLAYSAKRGYPFFGRDAVPTDEHHIRKLRGTAELMLRRWSERSHCAYLLKYEDLVRKPHDTLASLLAYVGVATDPGLTRHHAQKGI